VPYHNGMTRAQGDPGFFSFLGKVAGTVLRAAPGPVGLAARAILPGARTLQQVPQQRFPVVGAPGFPATIARAIPGGKTGLEVVIDPMTGCPVRKRRRRIDPLNLKALRRANSRQRSFLRAVDRTLKTMPTKGSVSSRRKKIAGAVK